MSSNTLTDVQAGWIGIGSQGGPMARVLALSGTPTMLWARRPESLDPYRDTPATFANSAAELIAAVDVLFVCVRDDAGVRELLVGDGTEPALSTMKPGSSVVIHSTIHPDLAIELAEIGAKYDVAIIDAPVSGGGHAAESRSLLVMTAGKTEDVEKVKPLLEVYGNPIPYLGEVGAAQRAKLVNNLMLTANMGVAESAFALGKQLGIDPANLFVVIENGSGRSFGLNMVRSENYDLSGAAAVAGPLLQKDARLLAELAESAGATPGTILDAADSALESMGLAR